MDWISIAGLFIGCCTLAVGVATLRARRRSSYERRLRHLFLQRIDANKIIARLRACERALKLPEGPDEYKVD